MSDTKSIDKSRVPEATLKYRMSLTYCMTTPLVDDSEGLGTLGMPQKVVREMFADTGFGKVRKRPCNNSFISVL